MQKFKFLMKNLRVTQKALDPYSHQGSLAMDFGGKDTGVDNIFAPCDIEIKRVRLNANGEVYFQSLTPVLFSDGTTDYAHGIVIHGDNRHLKVGQVIKQGEAFYTEGGWGSGNPNKFAKHLHLELGKGKFSSSRPIQFQSAYGVYVFENQYNIEKMCFIETDTKILNSGGYDWKIAQLTQDTENSEIQLLKNQLADAQQQKELAEKTLQAHIEQLNVADNKLAQIDKILKQS